MTLRAINQKIFWGVFIFLAVETSGYGFDLTSVISSAIASTSGASKILTKAASLVESNSSITIPAAGTMEVAFSPNEGGEALVVKTIASARTDIRMLAYSFTSAPVVQALLDAKHRGVDIKLVVDYESNVDLDRSGNFKSPKSIAALSALMTAGVDVRTVKVYAAHHDKVIIVDRQTVEVGSFNYSDAAARRNSENVLVNWNNTQLAKAYEGHFDRNYRQSMPFKPRY